jgi:hypothetical protein
MGGKICRQRRQDFADREPCAAALCPKTHPSSGAKSPGHGIQLKKANYCGGGMTFAEESPRGCDQRVFFQRKVMIMNVPTIGHPSMPSVVSGASTQAPPQQKMTSLFSQIDANGAGSITQAQFTQAFQTMNPPPAFQAAGASAIWNQLDPGGSGQVTQQDFVSGMKSLMVQLRQGNADGSNTQSQTTTSATQTLNALGDQPLNVII